MLVAFQRGKSYKIQTSFSAYHRAEIKSNILTGKNRPYIHAKTLFKDLCTLDFQRFQTSQYSASAKNWNLLQHKTAMPVSVAFGFAVPPGIAALIVLRRHNTVYSSHHLGIGGNQLNSIAAREQT